MADLLAAAELQAALAALPGWTVADGELVKTFRFASYLQGVEWVNRVAAEAERRNHHPDLHLGWRQVGVRLSTHSAGGLTRLDVELAARIERLAAEAG